MYTWVKYPDIDNLPRDLTITPDHLVYIQEKRDGSNISLWWNGETVAISSRNMEKAAPHLVELLKETEAGKRLLTLLGTDETLRRYVFYGELIPRGYGPTRVEGYNKEPEYVVFDIYDTQTKKLLPPSTVLKICTTYGLPMVQTIAVMTYENLDELVKHVREEILPKMRNREGVVLKIVKQGETHSEVISQKFVKDGEVFAEGFLAKLVRDIHLEAIYKVKQPAEHIPAERKRIKTQAHLPPIPDDKLMRAIANCYATEFNHDLDAFTDRKHALPLVAKYVELECREHGYRPPHGNKIYKTWQAFITNELVKQYKNYKPEKEPKLEDLLTEEQAQQLKQALADVDSP